MCKILKWKIGPFSIYKFELEWQEEVHELKLHCVVEKTFFHLYPQKNLLSIMKHVNEVQFQ